MQIGTGDKDGSAGATAGSTATTVNRWRVGVGPSVRLLSREQRCLKSDQITLRRRPTPLRPFNL